MNNNQEFGPSVEMGVVKLKNGKVIKTDDNVATEIPFTINVNETDIATILCSPINLKELAYGFIFTSGFIKSIEEIKAFSLDTIKWVVSLEIDKMPEPSLMEKRLYTSGCGKGILYSNIGEIAYRQPIENKMTINSSQVTSITKWFQHCSGLFKKTGAVHTAALSIKGNIPEIFFDDVGRHNAVDKVIGKALMNGIDFSEVILVSSGRTSSEILHKARACGIAINISRGAPTHQTVLRARDMGITVIGSVIGPIFAGWIFDMFGSYRFAWLAIICILIAGIIIMLATPPANVKRQRLDSTNV